MVREDEEARYNGRGWNTHEDSTGTYTHPLCGGFAEGRLAKKRSPVKQHHLAHV